MWSQISRRFQGFSFYIWQRSGFFVMGTDVLFSIPSASSFFWSAYDTASSLSDNVENWVGKSTKKSYTLDSV